MALFFPRGDARPGAAEFALLAAGTAATVLLFREYDIRRFAPLRLLFNGKIDPGSGARGRGTVPVRRSPFHRPPACLVPEVEGHAAEKAVRTEAHFGQGAVEQGELDLVGVEEAIL